MKFTEYIGRCKRVVETCTNPYQHQVAYTYVGLLGKEYLKQGTANMDLGSIKWWRHKHKLDNDVKSVEDMMFSFILDSKRILFDKMYTNEILQHWSAI